MGNKNKYPISASANIVASCQKDNVILYELDATADDENYTIREWIQTLSKTRLLTAVIVFPKNEPALLEKYSTGLFPTLSCP